MADSKPLENSTFASRAKTKDRTAEAKQVDEDTTETENKAVGSTETKKRTTARKS